jgi:hypothetical protein
MMRDQITFLSREVHQSSRINSFQVTEGTHSEFKRLKRHLYCLEYIIELINRVYITKTVVFAGQYQNRQCGSWELPDTLESGYWDFPMNLSSSLSLYLFYFDQ